MFLLNESYSKEELKTMLINSGHIISEMKNDDEDKWEKIQGRCKGNELSKSKGKLQVKNRDS